MENRPVPLKPPVWTWEVPLYFFVGGAAGVAAVIAAVAAAAGTDPAIARDARWIAAAGALLSPPLLIADLGRPSRFLYMLRVFKRQSAMSVGVWTLVLFSAAVFSSLALHLMPAAGLSSPAITILGNAADAIAALSGLVLATYTGVLLGATAIPIWAAHVKILPLHFGASSLGAAVSILELLGHRTLSLNIAGLGAAAIETVIGLWGLSIELRQNADSRVIVDGTIGRAARVSALLTGPIPLVLRLAGRTSTIPRVIAAICAIAGSAASRYAWLAAGRASAIGRAATMVVLAAIVFASSAQSPASARKLSIPALVASATKYVADYRQEFAFLIADETYTQETFDRKHARTGIKTMHGELFLTFMPVEREWIAVHDVADVDGVPLANREDLRALIERGQLAPVAQRLADRNASFNIGNVRRNFNEPTIGLHVLEAKRVANFKFTMGDVSNDGDRTLVTLAFTERERPTLVSGPRGNAVYARGEIVVDAGTGRVERTRLQFKEGAVMAELITTFAPETKLGLWVPLEFSEDYELQSAHEETRCRAEYSNYRKFSGTGRIK